MQSKNTNEQTLFVHVRPIEPSHSLFILLQFSPKVFDCSYFGKIFLIINVERK